MAVNKLTDIDRFGREGRIDEEYTPPVQAPFEKKEHLRSWLGDADGRDQMVMFRGDKVGVFWNDKEEVPDQVVDRENWTESFVQWSPQGTFLTSLHAQGVQLWGGSAWSRQKRFSHPGVNLVDFSPSEKYVTTWSHRPLQVDETHPVPSLSLEEDGKNYIIWDVATGKPLRSFTTIDVPSTVDDEGNPVKKKMQWPTFKWSSDDKFVARMTQGQSISIYELPRMNLLDKQSIKIEGVMDFEWAPATPKREGIKTYEQLLCYWTPELGSNPAKVGLMTLPSKEIVRTRNLFNVSDAKLHWQSEAAYVCVKVDRHSKSKKSMATNLEIFRVREKGVPVEVVDSIKDTVINFAWEPKGNRFVLITTGEVLAQTAVPPKTSVSFFAPEKLKGGAPGNFRHVRTVEKKNSNAIYWSPKGRFVIVATLQSQQSFDLDFWDLSFDKPKDDNDKEKDLNANLQLMNTVEHYGVTDIEWDPTGRYVATVASAFRHRVRFSIFASALFQNYHANNFRWKTATTCTTSKANSCGKSTSTASSSSSGGLGPRPCSQKKSNPRSARTCATTPRSSTSKISPRRTRPTSKSSNRGGDCWLSGSPGARAWSRCSKRRAPRLNSGVDEWLEKRTRTRAPRRLRRLSRRSSRRRRR